MGRGHNSNRNHDENERMPDPRNRARQLRRAVHVSRLLSGDYATADFTEANAVTLTLAPTGDGERVAVLEPISALASRQAERIGAAPVQFHHAAARVFGRAADRPVGQQIARLKIAPADGVMRELL